MNTVNRGKLAEGLTLLGKGFSLLGEAFTASDLTQLDVAEAAPSEEDVVTNTSLDENEGRETGEPEADKPWPEEPTGTPVKEFTEADVRNALIACSSATSRDETLKRLKSVAGPKAEKIGDIEPALYGAVIEAMAVPEA